MTTINEPPATATFDVANKHRELRERHNGHDRHVGGATGARCTAGSSPVAADSLTAMAQLATTALSLAKHITEQSSTRQIPSTPTTPHTPKRARIHHVANSNYSPSAQPLPSPSDIPCFMKYAKEKLGIKDAASYITTLQENRLGPDILGDADLEMLTSSNIGIPYGDALRLRKAAPSWWSNHSKRPRENSDNDPEFNPLASTTGNEQNTETPGMLRLRIEYPDGGKVSYWVQSLLQSDEQREHDKDTQYLDEETQEWRPIPYGFTAPKFSSEFVDNNGNIVLL